MDGRSASTASRMIIPYGIQFGAASKLDSAVRIQRSRLTFLDRAPLCGGGFRRRRRRISLGRRYWAGSGERKRQMSETVKQKRSSIRLMKKTRLHSAMAADSTPDWA